MLARDIPVQSLCEHHLLPFTGVAHIGYLPGERILGLSKLARVLDLFARDLQVQERLTQQVADWLQENLSPARVGVVIQAEHLCMSMRGVRARGARTTTSALHGLLREDARSRQEFFALTGIGALTGDEPATGSVRDRRRRAGRRQGGGDAARARASTGRSCWSPRSPSAPTSGRRCRRATCSAGPTARRRWCTRPAGTRSTTSSCAPAHRAVALDAAAHRLTLDDGEALPYAKLLLATGASPRRLPVPGADLDGVRYLRTLADSDRLLADLSRRRTAGRDRRRRLDRAGGRRGRPAHGTR